MDTLREIGVITTGELRRALRGGRVLVLLVLFLMSTGLGLLVFGWITRNARIGGPDGAVDQDAAGGSLKKLFTFGVAGGDAQLADALQGLPTVLLIVFILSCLALPLFIALMGFDQISADVAQKSVRYFVVRVRRSSLLLGKFLAQAAVLSVLALASVAMMTLSSKALDPGFGVGLAAATFLRLWLAALLFSMPWLALTALCSAAMRQSAVSLVVNIFLLLLLLLVWFIGQSYGLPGEVGLLGSVRESSAIAYLRFGSPWAFAVDLLHPAIGKALGGALGMLGFATLLLGLGALALKEKDW